MSLDFLNVRLKVHVMGSAGLSAVGEDYSGEENELNFAKIIGPFSNTIANTASLGADQLYSGLFQLSASQVSWFDLISFLNYMNQPGAAFARVKGYECRLLSVEDDPVYGTACSGVVICPSRTVTDASLTIGSPSLVSTQAAFTQFDVGTNVTGGGIPANTTITAVSGNTATMSANASANETNDTVAIVRGTSVAQLPGLTNSRLGNGDILAWATPGANGAPVTVSSYRLWIQNIDADHPATVQLTFVGGSN